MALNIIISEQTISGEQNLLKDNTYIIRPQNLCNIVLAYIVKIYLFIFNPQVTKVHFTINTLYCFSNSIQLGTSENIRLLLNKVFFIGKKNYNTKKNDTKFNQWLAGLIDGDGSFILSKKGYASLEITMDIRDSLCLHKIKNKYGGSIKIRSNINAIRYRLHHKKGLLKLINDINGEIRNSIRILQLIKICNKYSIEFIYPKPLTVNNNWLSGMFDADGIVTINKSNLQLSISISQKNIQILEILVSLFSGHIYIDRNSNRFKWYVTKKEDINNLCSYLKLYPCYSEKKNRLFLIDKFYSLKNLKHLPEYEKMLTSFFKKWDNDT